MHGAANEEYVGSDKEGIGALAGKLSKAVSISPIVAALRYLDLQSHCVCGFWDVSERALGSRDIGRIDEHGNTNGLWHQVMQESQPLGRQFRVEKIDASRVATGSGEVGDKTKRDRVCGDTEDDRDGRCCSFGSERADGAGRRGDHGHLSVDQIGHQCRQAIVVPLEPVVLDSYVLAFDVARFG